MSSVTDLFAERLYSRRSNGGLPSGTGDNDSDNVLGSAAPSLSTTSQLGDADEQERRRRCSELLWPLVTEREHVIRRGHWSWYLVYWLSVLLETFTATGNVMLAIYGGQSRLPFLEFVSAAYPRIVLWLLLSWLTNSKFWWKQYIKVDHPFAAWLTTSIAYVYLVMAHDTIGGLRIHAAVLFPFVYFCFIGNMRVLLKWLPWTKRSLTLYKFVRVYHLIFFTINQVLGQIVWGTTDTSTIAYFGTSLYLLRELLGLVLRREVALKPTFRAQKIAQRRTTIPSRASSPFAASSLVSASLSPPPLPPPSPAAPAAVPRNDYGAIAPPPPPPPPDVSTPLLQSQHHTGL